MPINYRPGGGYHFVSPDAPTGKMGPTGPSGPVGPTGATGATGATGPQGFSTGAVYFLNYDTAASSPSPVGYYDMSSIPSITLKTKSVTSNGNFLSFITPVGNPNQTEIPIGVWRFHFHVLSITGSGATNPGIYAEIYKWNGATETLIASNSTSPTVLNVVNYNQWYDMSVSFASVIPINNTDRIIVKLYTVDTTGYTIQFEYGDNVVSQVTTTLSQIVQGATGPQGNTGATGPQGATGAIGSLLLGNVLRVDAINGNDATASVGGNPYLTVEAAVAAATSGKTIWVLPGTYTLASPIVLPNGICLRGMNVQTTTIQMTGVTSNTTLLTMGENCRVEDVTLKLTSSGHYTLKGIVFGGSSSVTSKLRTSVLTVDNSGASSGGSSNVYGIECNGTGTLSAGTFSFNCMKGSTVNVLSNGGGNKRGILISNTNLMSTRDTNIYITQPTNTASTGSYVGVETNDPSDTGSIQLRSTTVGVVKPIAGQEYTASDILQTRPSTVTNPTYLASAGIQLGPGTDLVTKSAGTKPFSTYVYPTIVYYGLKGLLRSGVATGTIGYMWPGTQSVTNNIFPDPTTTPAAFFRVQQPAILSGISVYLGVPPSGTATTTIAVYRTPLAGVITPISGYTLTFTGTTQQQSYYNTTQDFAAGDLVHVGIVWAPAGNSNTTTDVTVQLDLF